MAIKVFNAQVASFSPVTTAKVGQTLKVKKVDENNKPTEWEAIDIPSGIIAVAMSESGSIDLSNYSAGTVFVLYDDTTESEVI